MGPPSWRPKCKSPSLRAGGGATLPGVRAADTRFTGSQRVASNTRSHTNGVAYGHRSHTSTQASLLHTHTHSAIIHPQVRPEGPTENTDAQAQRCAISARQPRSHPRSHRLAATQAYGHAPRTQGAQELPPLLPALAGTKAAWPGTMSCFLDLFGA